MSSDSVRARGEPTGRRTPEESAERDEALLRSGAPAYHVTIVSSAALSVGVTTDPRAPYVERARALGLPIVPRSTGGTGVLLGPGDLTWAVALPRGDPRAGRHLREVYARLGVPLVTVLRQHGIESEWARSPGRSPNCCMLGERGQVLKCAGGILSGAAQHLTSTTLLHHGSLARAVDRPAHRAIFDADDPSAFEWLCGTREVGLEMEPEALHVELARAFEAFLLGPP